LKHQEYAERTILRAMARKRIPHAYIFHGPDGVGKEKFARACARLFLCEAKGQAADSAPREACGTCPGCRAVAGETHPDLHIVHRYQSREHPDADVRKRKGLELGVDVIRHFLIDCVGLTSTRGRGKIFIVREADRITPQAQNALLKTLEEPPQQTFLFLLVSSPDRLLPTFLSRCQSVRFDALPSEFITAQLTPLMPDLSTQHVEWYARSSCGSLGWAVTAAKDELFELNERIVKGLAALHQPEVPHLTKGPRIDPAKDNVSIARKVAEADKNAKAWAEEADGLGERYRKRDPDITDTEATRRGLETIF